MFTRFRSSQTQAKQPEPPKTVWELWRILGQSADFETKTFINAHSGVVE